MDAQQADQDSMQDLDDTMDALSLCDLPIYGDSDRDGDSSGHFSAAEDHSSSSSSEQDDYFEFFSEEWSSPAAYVHHPGDKVVFCGKLIPYEQPVYNYPRKLENEQQKKHKKQRGLFRWNFFKSFVKKSGYSTSRNIKAERVRNDESRLYHINGRKGVKCDEKYDFPARRASILASPTKSRWHLFAFGLARFPAEMEIRDMRKRQSRRSPSPTVTRSCSSGGEESDWSGEKGLWGLVRTLGCGSQFHTDAMVAKS